MNDFAPSCIPASHVIPRVGAELPLDGEARGKSPSRRRESRSGDD